MNKNILAGIFMVFIGSVFCILSFFYSVGTLENIGPGFFPRIFSFILIFCGVLTALLKNDR